MATYSTYLHLTTSMPRLISTILFFGPLLSGQTGLGNRPFEASVVSFQQLEHKVPKAAREEMEKASRAQLKQRPDDAVEHLRNAVRIDPEYVGARNNLAVSLLRNDPASAIVELEQAINIDPHEAYLFHNLAIGYAMTEHLDAAERAARNAVDLDRTNGRMRAVLGIVLVRERKYTAETLANLEAMSKECPLLGLFAAEVLINQHELSKARSYVEGYLSSGDKERRTDAERWLEYIDQNLATSAAAVPNPALPVPR